MTEAKGSSCWRRSHMAYMANDGTRMLSRIWFWLVTRGSGSYKLEITAKQEAGRGIVMLAADQMLNMLANLAGYFGNHLTGWLRSRLASENDCLLVLASCYLVGVFLSVS